MNSYFNEIILTRREFKTLKYIAKHKRVKEEEIDSKISDTLFKYHLITYNHTRHKNELGERVLDGTISVTDEYVRYKKFKRNNFIDSKIPIIISVIALLKSFSKEILWLIQSIM